MSPDRPAILQRVLKKQGRRAFASMTFRHTFATMALQNDVSVKTVSSMPGHYLVVFTLNTCAHVTTDVQFKAAQTAGNILSRAV